MDHVGSVQRTLVGSGFRRFRSDKIRVTPSKQASNSLQGLHRVAGPRHWPEKTRVLSSSSPLSVQSIGPEKHGDYVGLLTVEMTANGRQGRQRRAPIRHD